MSGASQPNDPAAPSTDLRQVSDPIAQASGVSDPAGRAEPGPAEGARSPGSARRGLGLDSIVAAVAVLAVAGTGGALTRLDDWYFALKQPAFKPPDWVFGPAWTLLFFLIAWAAVLGWRTGATHHPSPRIRMLVLLAVNALANVSWSLLYFFMRRPDWALLEVVVLWGSIAALIVHFRPYAPRAAWLLTPYLAWVSFAAALNLEAVRLNQLW